MTDLNRPDPRSLRTTREACGFSVDYAARMLDVKPRDIEKWESGDDVPSENELTLLAQLYSVELAELTGKAPAKESEKESPHDGAQDGDDRKDASSGEPRTDPRTDTGDTSLFGQYLMENERILWVGRPDPAYSSTRIPFPAQIFMLFWLGFAVFWTVTAASAGGFFALFGLPFVGIGLYMNFGYRITERKRKEGIRYALTNQRALIVSDGKDPFFHTVALTPYLSVFCHRGKDGYGTVFLGPDAFSSPAEPHYGRRQNQIPQGPDPRLHFVDVKDADEVCRLVNEIAHGKSE